MGIVRPRIDRAKKGQAGCGKLWFAVTAGVSCEFMDYFNIGRKNAPAWVHLRGIDLYGKRQEASGVLERSGTDLSAAPTALLSEPGCGPAASAAGLAFGRPVPGLIGAMARRFAPDFADALMKVSRSLKGLW